MKKQTVFFLFTVNIIVLIPFLIYLGSLFFQMHQTTWKYQCIDTMKVSRDEARFLEQNKNAQKEIAQQMEEITKLGANCVAIDTPYDAEFIPILTVWVTEARKQRLHVWFRGNFSSWEGWFGYPKGMTTNDLLIETKKFIHNNKNLFVDGDIFTPAPEAENGWPGNYVSQNDYPAFRQFLIDEYSTSQDSFRNIHKNVDIWLSMNGGLARNMLNEHTIQATGNKVTIDHYVHSPKEMADYVDYFYQKFSASVIIGEFGAPIPDINGTMSDQQQAAFVSSIFDVLYNRKKFIYGVNYWVLAGGSTSIVGKNFEEKPVANEIMMYYKSPLQIIFQKFVLIFH